MSLRTSSGQTPMRMFRRLRRNIQNFVAPPLQTEPASLSFGLVVRFHWCGNLKQLYMESLRRLRLSAMTAFLRNCPGNLSGCNGRTHRFAPTVLKRSLPRIDVHPKFASTQRGYVHALQCSTEMYAYRGSFCRATPKGVAKQQRRRSRNASGRCPPREGALFWGSSCRVTPKGVTSQYQRTKRNASGRCPPREGAVFWGSFCRATPKGVASQYQRTKRNASGRCPPREGAVFWGSFCRATPKGVASQQRRRSRDASGRCPPRQVWCCAKNASLQSR